MSTERTADHSAWLESQAKDALARIAALHKEATAAVLGTKGGSHQADEETESDNGWFEPPSEENPPPSPPKKPKH